MTSRYYTWITCLRLCGIPWNLQKCYILIWQVDTTNRQVNINIWNVDIIIWQHKDLTSRHDSYLTSIGINMFPYNEFNKTGRHQDEYGKLWWKISVCVIPQYLCLTNLVRRALNWENVEATFTVIGHKVLLLMAYIIHMPSSVSCLMHAFRPGRDICFDARMLRLEITLS